MIFQQGGFENRCCTAPIQLQHWLQMTYELENKQYIKRKMAAKQQLQQAKKACEKLRKKRSSFVGAFVSMHGTSFDNIDRSIAEARTALNEITQELQEQAYRWKQIESLCGFSIINNSRLANLENMLSNKYGRYLNVFKGHLSDSENDLDNDTSSIYTSRSSCGHFSSRSSSEGNEEPTTKTGRIRSPSLSPQLSQPSPRPPRRTNGANCIPSAGSMVRRNPSLDVLRSKINTIKGPVPTSSVDDDVCSTDSSIVDEEIKRRQRKPFDKKVKTKK